MTLPTSTVNTVESQNKNPIFVQDEKELDNSQSFVLPGIKS